MAVFTVDNPASADLRAYARQMVMQKKVTDARVKLATGDLMTWLLNFTRTKNPHFQEQGLSSAFEPFPDKPHLRALATALEIEPILFIEKSREMLVSWILAGWATRHAMLVPMREIVLQHQKEDKVIELVDYCKTLYEQQPDWLKAAHPLTVPLNRQPGISLEFAHGGRIIGIPGGSNQVRSFHPWAYLSDEAAFQPEAGGSYDNAAQVCKRLIVNSTAGPGWFADVVNDVMPSGE